MLISEMLKNVKKKFEKKVINKYVTEISTFYIVGKYRHLG